MTTTLGDLTRAGALELGDGYRTSTRELGDEGYRIIRVADINVDGSIAPSMDSVRAEFRSKIGVKRAEPGDVLLTTKGTVGRVAVVPDFGFESVYSPQLCWFRVGDDTVIHARYLRYWLQSDEFLSQARYMQGNTDMAPYISLRDLRAASISLPTPPEQRAIAEVLGALDDKIAANTRLASIVDEYLQTLFRRLAREHTTEVPLMDAIDIRFGEPFRGDGFAEPGTGRPLIRIRDLKTGKPQFWTSEERTREHIVQPGDVIVGMDAEFRATMWPGVAGVLNQRVLAARSEVFGRALTRELLRQPLAEIEGEKSATTVIHLNKADLLRKTVDVPPPHAIAAFRAIADPLYGHAVAVLAENRTLAGTRDALLPKLMSGAIRVKGNKS